MDLPESPVLPEVPGSPGLPGLPGLPGVPELPQLPVRALTASPPGGSPAAALFYLFPGARSRNGLGQFDKIP